MSKRATTLKHGVPVEPAAITDAQGRPMVPVLTLQSLPFSQACIALLTEDDGKDHRWKLKLRSFWVPEAFIEKARQRVEEEARRRAEGKVAL